MHILKAYKHLSHLKLNLSFLLFSTLVITLVKLDNFLIRLKFVCKACFKGSNDTIISSLCCFLGPCGHKHHGSQRHPYPQSTYTGPMCVHMHIERYISTICILNNLVLKPYSRILHIYSNFAYLQISVILYLGQKCLFLCVLLY